VLRTEKKLIGGEWVEVPVMLIGPTDVALLIDRFQVLFDGPSTISEGCGVNVTSGMLPIDALQAIIERTRGLAAPDLQASPIPRAPRRLDDSTVCLRSCGIHGLRAMDPCRIPKAAAGRVSSGHFSNSRSATCPTPTRP
jgi:hypothetical protein